MSPSGPGSRPARTADESSATAPTSRSLIRDRFEDDRPPGAVGGTSTTGGTPRHVVDVEGRVSIDRRALRFAPIRTAGWARQGIAYGPTPARPGLVFEATVLNGHNGSHSGGIDGGLRRRFKDWLLGPRDRNPARRLLDLARSPRRAESLWLWRLWLSRWWGARSDPSMIGDNLAVGWFDRPEPTDPLAQGHALVVRTNEAETGRLVASVRGGDIDVVPVVLNVPTTLAVVIGSAGVTYLASSLPAVSGFGTRPELRPLAVDRSDLGPDEDLHPGVHQSVLGQVGFSADTRVHHVDVDEVPDWSSWWTTADRADELSGEGPIDSTDLELGQAAWRTIGPTELHRSATGLRAVGGEVDVPGLVLAPVTDPRGLVAVSVTIAGPDDRVGLVVRADDDGSRLVFEADVDGARLVQVSTEGSFDVVADDDVGLEPGTEHLLQLSDDGLVVAAHVDSRSVAAALRHPEPTTGIGAVGLTLAGTGGRLRRFEAHPRAIVQPGDCDRDIRDLALPVATTVVLEDRFEHPQGDLAGRSPAPGIRWRRAVGTGVIETSSDRSGARVKASLDAPGPNRTVYLLPLPSAERPTGGSGVAEIELMITPPGTGRGEGHRGRVGVVFWQDADHHVMVSNWLDDTYPGASLSLFCRLGPFEDVFRAVWSNVGQRIDWGAPHRLRVAFDGSTLAAEIDDELVLYRAIADVHPDIARIDIDEVGIVANWEWGTDTGSTVDRFVVRSGR